MSVAQNCPTCRERIAQMPIALPGVDWNPRSPREEAQHRLREHWVDVDSNLEHWESRVVTERVDYHGPGHFCGAASCRFWVHSHIGPYCVSTIGEYYPYGNETKPESLGGSGYAYETLVFDMTSASRWTELAGQRYETAEEAREGHDKYMDVFAARFKDSGVA